MVKLPKASARKPGASLSESRPESALVNAVELVRVTDRVFPLIVGVPMTQLFLDAVVGVTVASIAILVRSAEPPPNAMPSSNV